MATDPHKVLRDAVMEAHLADAAHARNVTLALQYDRRHPAIPL